jgi:DNA-directed RNA polymerase subunit RPC12/RpoP
MRMRALVCRQCGAPLDVPARIEHLACDYCGCHIEVHRRPAPAEKANAASREHSPEERRARQALDELDREWEEYRATYLPRNRTTGEYDVHDPEHCRAGAALVAIAGSLGVPLLFWWGGVDGLALLAAMTTTVLLVVLLRQAKIGRVYQNSLRNYREARADLARRLRDAELMPAEGAGT